MEELQETLGELPREANLPLAVIYRALLDSLAIGKARSKGYGSTRLSKKDADEWFFSTSRDFGSFLYYCDLLGIPEKAILDHMRESTFLLQAHLARYV